MGSSTTGVNLKTKSASGKASAFKISLVETGESRTPPPTSVEQLLPQLLNQLEQLGETARQLKQALGSNGHRAEKLKEIREYLEHQTSK